MTEKADRRKHPRRPACGRARLGTTLLAYVRDLSAQGARLSVVTEMSLKPDEVYPVRIIVTDLRPVEFEARAKVVWAERVGGFCDVGVRFLVPEAGAEAAVGRVRGEAQPGEPIPGVRVELLPPDDEKE